MKDVVVQFDHVSLAYNRDEDVFRDLNLSLEAGEFYFLTGPSGSGKTSLLKLMYMGLAPSYGKVEIFGADIFAIAQRHIPFLRQNIGIVFQDCFLLSHLTIAENVAIPLKLKGIPHKQAVQNAEELLNWVGLSRHTGCYPDVLSGGQQQRAAIARAVINRPGLILADEPTGNVDRENSERILHLFEELNGRGTTVVIATHDRALANAHNYPELMIQNKTIQRTEHPRRVKSFEDEVRKRVELSQKKESPQLKSGGIYL
jgi:cell division transport system ATP-binding protein